MGAEHCKNSWWRSIMLRNGRGGDNFGRRFYPEQKFQQKLVQERKRAERAGKPLMVMIINARYLVITDFTALMRSVGEGLQSCLRETDICGVFGGCSAGVILTEVTAEKIKDTRCAVAKKVREMLEARFVEELARRITISFRIYPETGGEDSAFDVIFYPEIASADVAKTAGLIVKRLIDILGSVGALILLSPLFLLLPIAIKYKSKGPVLFIQERYGLNGERFNLFKFRSMHVDNDDGIHRQFVKQLIDGTLADGESQVYKITSDPRVTSVGRILRSYSLDELPQFLNVLKGDMSLVGPRPPIQYEVENYSGWQRNRMIGKRPGITGLWQVHGRSATTFDEMVRLDLRYLREWSVMLDVKIIAQTPLAVLRCRGAY
jgi:lipopolysaccharide/colanic/teichoic acid biosynthesis glycosyltransferase